MKIGILVPKSKQFVTIDNEFISGIKLGFPNAKLFIESISIGADSNLIIEKIQKLHFQEDINIIIGLLGHWNQQEIFEYTSQNKIVFIMNELGATLPLNEKKYDSVFINSYQLCESVYFLNKHLKEKKITKIATSTSYYDCGYGMLSAIEYGSIDNKIKIEGHYITPFIPRDNEAEIMELTINNIAPEAVIAFHSGLYAEEHATFLKKTNLQTNYPYYITPFTFNEQFYSKINQNSYIIASWLPTLDCSFNKIYNEKFRKNASPFSLLGFESGKILSEALENIGEEFNPEKIIERITHSSIDGPRGKIIFTTSYKRSNYDHHIYKINNTIAQHYFFEKTHSLLNDESFIEKTSQLKKEGEVGGWQNAYLCH